MTTLGATFRTAALAAWANRRSFWVQVAIMLANDLAWVAFWILFFARVGNLRGWDASKVLLLFAILTTVAGTALGLFANARRIGELAADGEIDAALTLPVHPLSYLLARKVDTALLGDLLFGPLLFVAAGHPTLERAALYLAASLCGSAVLIGFLVAAGSLTFFVGGRGEQADLGFQAILLLASYPLDVFGGATKLLLFSVVPAAFVTGLPVRLVTDFSAATAATLMAAALGFSALGIGLFQVGLSRYSSGSLWTGA
jgi:ABC-2 type transport system permease protein